MRTTRPSNRFGAWLLYRWSSVGERCSLCEYEWGPISVDTSGMPGARWLEYPRPTEFSDDHVNPTVLPFVVLAMTSDP
jgi:hypothetical protein